MERAESWFGLSVRRLPPAEVDDLALPAGTLLQHLADEDGWWVSTARQDQSHEIRIYDVATVWIDASLSLVTVRAAPDVSDAWLAFQMQLHVLPVLRMIRGEAVFHAAALALDGRPVLILGDGRGGKSTTTALLLRDGARFVSDDQTGVTTDFHLIGTEDLWLRPHSAALAPASAQTRHAGDDRTVVKLLSADVPAPVAGVLLLGERIVGGSPTIEPVLGGAAVEAMLGQIFVGGLLDRVLIERHFRVAAELAATCPVARLHVPSGPPWPVLRPTLERWLEASR